jgi:hypothetical protein
MGSYLIVVALFSEFVDVPGVDDIVACLLQRLLDGQFDVLVEQEAEGHREWGLFEILGTEPSVFDFFEALLAALLDLPHLVGVFVIVGERAVHVGHIEIVPVGDRLRFEPPAFDALPDIVDADAGAVDAGFAADDALGFDDTRVARVGWVVGLCRLAHARG